MKKHGFEMVEHVGVVRTDATGWRKELNIVSWSGNPPRYDIREWEPGYEKCSRGATFSEKEMETLFELLKKREPGELNGEMPNMFERTFDNVAVEVKRHIGVLKDYSTGWKREVNIASWSKGRPVYDVRDWDPEHRHMSSGITLTEKDARCLVDLLMNRKTKDTAK